tara:strand:- start:1019 stop:1438 length:420 start_codon:yes stop_codon:yes gene_type:complete
MKNIVNASKRNWIGLDCYIRHKPHRIEIGKAGIFWDNRPTARYNFDQVISFHKDYLKIYEDMSLDIVDRMVPPNIHIRFTFKDGQWVTASFNLEGRGIDLFEMAYNDWKDNGLLEGKDIMSEDMKGDIEYGKSTIKERI